MVTTTLTDTDLSRRIKWAYWRGFYDSEEALESARAGEATALERVAELEAEIEQWKSSSGLERGGDSDAVRPEDLAVYLARLLELAERAASEECRRGDNCTNTSWPCTPCKARRALGKDPQ